MATHSKGQGRSTPRRDGQVAAAGAAGTAAPRRHAIEVLLLGGFEVRVDGQAIANAQWKLRHPRQLFQMLALERDGLSREQVLAVLWPDTDPAAAANRLHHTLHLLRGVFVAAGLPKSEPVALLEADAVRLNPAHAFEVDAQAFARCLVQARAGTDRAAAQAALQQALAVHRGELAHGLPADEWLSQHREALRVEFAWVLDQLAAAKRDAGDLEAAIGLHQQLVDIDPGHELAHRSLMELYDATGHPERAIHQYSVCKRLLQHELDVEPSPATRAVLERILSAPQSPVALGVRATDQAAQRWQHQGVPYAVPLLGREADVQALVDQLTLPQVRMVTVTGPAGMGKSRVAHAAVERSQQRFRNGAIVVSCAGLSDHRQVASAIARALGVVLAADGSGGAQLMERLRPCQLLLLLDRFEHLRAAAPRLSTLLQGAPELKLLVTSQVALRVDAEQVLALPSLLQRDAAAAVDLFCRVAANAGVPIAGAAALEQVAAICRRLDGNPMAIELAAGQTPMMALPQILLSLEQPLALLTNAALDVEPQQRSLREAIAWTCSVLDADAQGLLYALSVFGGSCTSDEPATAFAGLWPASTLAHGTQALADAHLLRRRAAPGDAGSTCFEMPHAIAQFAAERLLEWPRRDAVQAAHAAHAAAQVHACFRRMRDDGWHDSAGLTLYHRPSWQRAVVWLARHGSAEAHLTMAYQYGVLALMVGATGSAVDALRGAALRDDLATPEARRLAAWCAYRLARAHTWHAERHLAPSAIRKARRMARAVGDDDLQDHCLVQLAVAHIDLGRVRQARWLLHALIGKHEAQQRWRELVRDHSLMAALHSQGGELTAAVEAAQRALHAARQLGSEQHIAYAAASLCEASLRVGDLALAQQLVALYHGLPDHAITALRRHHFRLLECVADFECGDFESARDKTRRLLESLRALPMARTQAVARLLAEMVAVEQGQTDAAPVLDDEFAAMPTGLHYDELAVRLHCYRMRRAVMMGRTRRALSAVQALAHLLARQRQPLWWAWALEACALAASMRGDARTCQAALALSKQALRRAGCQPSPRQQRNWAHAQAAVATSASSTDEPRALLPAQWPKSDAVLIERLVAVMEHTLLGSQITSAALG